MIARGEVDTTDQQLEQALALIFFALGFLPVAGQVIDVVDIVISIARRDIAGLALSIIPVIGDIRGGLKRLHLEAQDVVARYGDASIRNANDILSTGIARLDNAWDSLVNQRLVAGTNQGRFDVVIMRMSNQNPQHSARILPFESEYNRLPDLPQGYHEKFKRTMLGNPHATRNSLDPDLYAIPAGTRTEGDSWGRHRENINAYVLRRRYGYNIIQNPTPTALKSVGYKGDKRPDFIIEGRVFDQYANQGGDWRKEMSDKVGTGQANRIVLDLSHPNAVEWAVIRANLVEYPIPNLQEVIVIKNGQIIEIYIP
jgi:hypothetical protein